MYLSLLFGNERCICNCRVTFKMQAFKLIFWEVGVRFDGGRSHVWYWFIYLFEKKYSLFQLRDARKAEQASNPYYVKSSAQSSPRPNHNSIQVDDIPVAAIDLNVSLKIPGELRRSYPQRVNHYMSKVNGCKYMSTIFVYAWCFGISTRIRRAE